VYHRNKIPYILESNPHYFCRWYSMWGWWWR